MGKILRFTIGELLMHVRTLSFSFRLLFSSSSISLLLFSLLLCGVFCAVLLCRSVWLWLFLKTVDETHVYVFLLLLFSYFCHFCVWCVGGGGGVCTFITPLRVYIEKRLRVHRHHARMWYTCGRGAGTHRDVMNVHTGAFSVSRPHTTSTPHRTNTQRHTHTTETQPQPTHSTTHNHCHTRTRQRHTKTHKDTQPTKQQHQPANMRVNAFQHGKIHQV